MSAAASIDFSKYAQSAPAQPQQIDFSKYEQSTPESTQQPGFWDTLQREGKALEGSISGMPAYVYHAFSEPATEEEKQKFGGEDQVTGPKRIGLGLHRLLTAPVENAVDWYSDALKGKIPDAYEQALSVAPEAIGSAVGNMIAAKGAEGAPAAITKAAPVISDLAKSAADRAAMAARKVAQVTPKQAAQTAGAVSGAVGGHGSLGAYFGAKTFGRIAESILGKDRANAPIFKVAADQGLSLDDMADRLAQVISDDREMQVQRQASGLRTASTPKAQPASQTGEALATIGQKPPEEPTPQGGKAASGPRFTQSDRAAAKSLLEDALKQQSEDVIDQAIPPSGKSYGANLATKARVEFYLQRGDLQNAEAELDKGAKQAGTYFNPPRASVPSTNDIRSAIQSGRWQPDQPNPIARPYSDAVDDQGVNQELQWQMERHGWSANSEARREFIARNSTGMTKGELTRRFRAQTAKPDAAAPGNASPAAGSSTTDDLMEVLQKSLDAVRARQQGK